MWVVRKRNSSDSNTPINGYESTIVDVKGSVLELASGLHVRLLGVERDRTDVEMFLKKGFLNKPVALYADSHSSNQYITSADGVVDAYVTDLQDPMNFCINRQVVQQYPKTIVETELLDSIGWISKKKRPEKKPNLALYMKQRTFWVQLPDGSLGTGFFINENGLAVTNWHVLQPQHEKSAAVFLYEDNADDSKIYLNKKRNIDNIKWWSDINGLDITIFTVRLEPGEKVAYFNIAEQRPNQGDKVATYGNPHGLAASYTDGSVSAFREDPYNPNRGVDLVQYNMGTNGGNSGGPVCDIYGQIVAIHELGDKEMQNVNYGIDAMQLRKVLDQQNLKYGGQ